MNKKITVIELLNKIANEESYRPTVKYQEMTYTYHWDIGDYTNDFNSEYGIFSGWALNLMLNNEVEILEDNTEDIEEIKVDTFEQLGYEVGKLYLDFAKGIAKAVNELNNNIKDI